MVYNGVYNLFSPIWAEHRKVELEANHWDSGIEKVSPKRWELDPHLTSTKNPSKSQRIRIENIANRQTCKHALSHIITYYHDLFSQTVCPWRGAIGPSRNLAPRGHWWRSSVWLNCWWRNDLIQEPKSKAFSLKQPDFGGYICNYFWKTRLNKALCCSSGVRDFFRIHQFSKIIEIKLATTRVESRVVISCSFLELTETTNTTRDQTPVWYCECMWMLYIYDTACVMLAGQWLETSNEF